MSKAAFELVIVIPLHFLTLSTSRPWLLLFLLSWV